MMFKHLLRRSGILLVAMGALTAAAPALQAAEISMVSGLYKSESDTAADTDVGKKQTIEVGLRFADPIDHGLYWFVQGDLQMKSYDKGDNSSAPSDSTGLALNGGLRYYFNKLGENISPYAEGALTYKDTKDAAQGVNQYTESEQNGLYYSGSFGIRFNLAREFFMDLQTQLFESALFATETAKTTALNGGQSTTTKTETKRTELYIASTGPLAAQVALGMRF
jgi:hypothetical protein